MSPESRERRRLASPPAMLAACVTQVTAYSAGFPLWKANVAAVAVFAAVVATIEVLMTVAGRRQGVPGAE